MNGLMVHNQKKGKVIRSVEGMSNLLPAQLYGPYDLVGVKMK